MKKYYLLILFSFLICCLQIKSQSRNDLYKKVKIMLLQPYESSELKFSDSKVDIEFSPVYGLDGYYFINVIVSNKTEKRIYIEWDNARINGSKAVFNDDRKLFLNNSKSDEVVISGEKSESRSIMPKENVGDDRLYPFFYNNSNGFSNIPIILPIRYSNDDVIDYKFTIQFSKYSETEIDSMYAEKVKYYNLSKSLKKKMTIEQVKEIMGEFRDGSYIMESDGNKRYISLDYPSVQIWLDNKGQVRKVDRY